MANEIKPFDLGETGRTVYAVEFSAAGLAWDGAADVTYTTTRDTFDRPLAELGVTGVYGPLSLAGSGTGRSWLIYLQAGATPSHADDILLAVGDNTANDAATLAWTQATRTLTAGTNIVLAKGVGVTGFNDLSAVQVNAEVDTALAEYDAPTNAELTARTLPTADYATAAALATVDTVVDAILVDTAEIGAAGGGLTALATASALATVDTVVDAIRVTTDKLDDTLEDDAGVFRFTVNALEQAPSGTGASAETIADAVWDEARAGHVAAGSFGQGVASVQGNVTGSVGSVTGAVGSVTGNVGGNVVGSVDSVVDPVTVGANNDKTGYSLTQAFPTNFAALGINASGHVARVTLVDTTTANTDMRGTDDALLAASYTTPPSVGEIADSVWDEVQSGHTTAGTFGLFVDAQVSAIEASLDPQEVRDAMKLAPSAGVPADGSIDDMIGDIDAGINRTIDPNVVSDARTWKFANDSQVTSPNYIVEAALSGSGDGITLAMHFALPLNSGQTIDTVDSVTITGADALDVEPVVVSNNPAPDMVHAHITLDLRLATAGRYTVDVGITSSDAQNITRRGTLVLE